MKYYRAFDTAGYHSAFLTTFAFSVGAFEDTVLPRLRGAGCRNIHLMADQEMINLEFAEIGLPRFAGSHYHLIKVKAPGRAAFHPKIVLQLGRTKGRLFVGSANLTGPGLAGNLELVSELHVTNDDEAAAPIFTAVLEYLRSWANENDEWFFQGLTKAIAHTPWLRGIAPNRAIDLGEAEGELSFLSDTSDKAIHDQIVEAVGADRVRRLIVVSPFWDQQLAGLKNLTNALDNPTVSLVLPPLCETFPKDAFVGLSGDFYTSKALSKSRSLHAKLFIAEGESFDHIVSGSINCSRPALTGLTRQSDNAEAGLYRRVPKGTAIGLLGIDKVFEDPIALSDLTEPEDPDATDADGQTAPPDGGVLRMKQGFLEWIYSGANAEGAMISVYSREGTELEADIPVLQIKTGHYRLRPSSLLNEGRTAIVTFGNGSKSAPLIMENIGRLRKHAETKSGGAARKASEFLLESVDESLELLECLQTLHTADLEEKKSETETSRIARNQNNEDDEVVSGTNLSYEAFIKGRQPPEGQERNFGFSTLNAGRVGEVSAALNKMIGLLGPENDILEDAELFDDGEDLDSEEQGVDQDSIGDRDAPEDDQPTNPNSSTPKDDELDEKKAIRKRIRNKEYAAKIVQAVAVFESRLGELKDETFPVVELVRLRALLQLLLAFGSAINSEPSDARPLPTFARMTVATKDANDWPRLIGRILSGLFRVHASPFAKLEIEAEMATLPDEVIIAWGTALWAIDAAVAATAQRPESKSFSGMLSKIEEKVRAQILTETRGSKVEMDAVQEIYDRMAGRFGRRLGIGTDVSS